MATKKKLDLALHEEIETQEDWENYLQKEGLLVVDVYQGWSGPCKAAGGLFRRLKTELNDDFLTFAAAKADTVESLERYRGKCEPCFLLFGGGNLVAVVRGVNPPELEKHILAKLKQEHEVMKGENERTVIRDPVLLAEDLAEEEERRRREEEEEVDQEVTIAVLKPDIVSSGRVEEIIEDLREKEIEILERKVYQFTKEEAEEFYANVKSEPYFGKLVEFMTSGPSEILICAKGAEGVIEELRGLIGPAVVDAEEPIGLRAKYASDVIRNAIHASDGTEEAARELAFFYPDFERPIVRVRRPKILEQLSEEAAEEAASEAGQSEQGIQRTVALIQPHAYAKYKGAILERIQESGFVIAAQKEIQLTQEQAEMMYKEHVGQTYFGELTAILSASPMLALLLARQDAVEAWRKLVGPHDIEEAKLFHPKSLRAQFPPDDEEEEELAKVNAIYASANEAEAERDAEYFFPTERTVALIKPDAYANRDEIIERIKSAGFHVAARKDTQLDEEVARQLYANHQDKPFFEELVKHMISGPTLFMVLTREDAVSGWRKLMGPVDPDKAADEAPDNADPYAQNIRAIYGRNILENAVHGSSSAEHAAKTIELIFKDPDVGLPGKPVESTQGVEREDGGEREPKEGEEADADASGQPDADVDAGSPEQDELAPGKMPTGEPTAGTQRKGESESTAAEILEEVTTQPTEAEKPTSEAPGEKAMQDTEEPEQEKSAKEAEPTVQEEANAEPPPADQPSQPAEPASLPESGEPVLSDQPGQGATNPDSTPAEDAGAGHPE